MAKRAVFELRTYALKPTHVGPFMALSKEKFHLRTAHSILNGYWFHELGSTLNAATHIWQYDSLSHRAQVRAALAGDPDWVNGFVKHLLPCLESQVNKVCQVPAWAAEDNVFLKGPPKSVAAGAFELVTACGVGEKDAVNYAQKIGSTDGVQFQGALETIIGDQGETSFLFRHDNVDTTMHGVSLDGQKSVVMLPAPWSPLQ